MTEDKDDAVLSLGCWRSRKKVAGKLALSPRALCVDAQGAPSAGGFFLLLVLSGGGFLAGGLVRRIVVLCRGLGRVLRGSGLLASDAQRAQEP
ncbi:MAG: hypothetical protein B6A08_02080 [Sorangiineae bacterium NIC37A_2]|nr:MAG: hypothetical protein B6A08_02080 [Sorangiineae bacterium NIC37A_2]